MAARIRQDRAEAAEHARLLAELAEAGIPVTDGLPDGAAWLHSLTTADGSELTAEAHAGCPGRGAAFQPWNPLHPVYYCTSPADSGHLSRHDTIHAPANSASSGGGDGQDGLTGTAPLPEAEPDPSRRLVIAGNKAWAAAAEVRHRWLAASLFPRRTVSRDAAAFLTAQLLAMPDPLHTGLPAARHKLLFPTLTGRTADQWLEECATATPGRLTVIMLAPIITAYETAMTDGEGRNTWRTDRYGPCPRRSAAAYLTFLAALGYHLSDIEQAVASLTPWTGDAVSDPIPDTDPGTSDLGKEQPASQDDDGDHTRQAAA